MERQVFIKLNMCVCVVSLQIEQVNFKRNCNKIDQKKKKKKKKRKKKDS